MARNRNTSTSRIDLSFGGGHIDCLLDLVSGTIERYCNDLRDFPSYGEEVRTDGLHTRLGGKQYYQSRSGASGAGWVPARPTLKKLGTYRVDVGGVLLGFSPEREFAPHVGEFEIYAPFSYRGDNSRLDHPVVVRERDGKTTLLAEWQLAPFLRGQVETEIREYTFTYLKDSANGEQKLVANVYQPKDHYDRTDGRAARLLVEGFNVSTLEFVYPEGWAAEGDGEFWKRLGFRRLPNGLYKVVRNIARYKLEGWDNLEQIKKSVPANVHIIAPHLYIQERDGQYVGVARYQHGGAWYDFEVYIESTTAFKIFAGDREETQRLEQELEQGAREKYRRHLADHERQEAAARNELARDQAFRELLEQNAEVELSIEDSLAAGNCRPGTDDFVARFFPGRTTATVKELSRFVANWSVRRVLMHKLLSVHGQTAKSGVDAYDLKRIASVTAKIEQKLNDAGFFHLWQLAGLTPEQAVALDRMLGLNGQVERDGWVAQAQQLNSAAEQPAR